MCLQMSLAPNWDYCLEKLLHCTHGGGFTFWGCGKPFPDGLAHLHPEHLPIPISTHCILCPPLHDAPGPLPGTLPNAKW